MDILKHHGSGQLIDFTENTFSSQDGSRHWWPMLFFVVFKSPPEGRTHVFRPGEPFAQFTIIPEECDFELVEMSEEEAAERELQSRRIYESRTTLGADSQWVSASNTVFDATYRRIHGAARKLPPR